MNSYLITIIIGAICFVNGISVAWAVLTSKDASPFALVTLAVVFGLFGCVIFTIGTFVDWSKWLFNWILNYSQIKFWIMWIFSKKFRELSEDKLEALNRFSLTYVEDKIKREKKWGLREKMWLSVLKKIRSKYPRDYFNWIDDQKMFEIK